MLNTIMDNRKLDLGWCQGYMALKYHMEEALMEKNLDTTLANEAPPFALFSRKYYSELTSLQSKKIHDFCFIGSISSDFIRRKWVIEFAKKHFTEKSVFVNTDNDPNWVSLGKYDYSNKMLGFNPKNQVITNQKMFNIV